MYTSRAFYNGFHTHYPTFPYRHHGMNVYSSCDITEPLPVTNVNICAPTYCRREWPYYSYYDYLPPIVQTNVQSDVCYYYNEPKVIYDDDYGSTYRLARSKVALVDTVPRKQIRTYPNHMVVSTYRPKVAERIVVPRSTVVRHTSIPSYERRSTVRVVPLYNSAPQYIMTSRN